MRAFLVQDIFLGDSGKGTIVDYLVRHHPVDCVVRWNGGPQAAHNVVTKDQHHTFAMFGSGFLADPEIKTYLGPDVLINPLNILLEGAHLEDITGVDPFPTLHISPACSVITPYHVALNRFKESCRGEGRHGSCGQGFAEARYDQIFDRSMILTARDLEKSTEHELHGRLNQIRHYLIKRMERFLVENTCDWAADAIEHRSELLKTDPLEVARDYKRFMATGVRVSTGVPVPEDSTVVFEGSQGVLLDEKYGFPPYHTWSDCTFTGADRILDTEQIWRRTEAIETTRIGVCRAYATRHGAGPLPTEFKTSMTNAFKDPAWVLQDEFNIHNPWQREMRFGYTDLVLLDYAKQVIGDLDYLAITHLDQVAELSDWKVATGYILPDGGVLGTLQHKPLEREDALNRMADLGALIDRSRPEYETTMPSTLETILSGHLETPVGIRSFGPGASDKVAVPALTPA